MTQIKIIFFLPLFVQAIPLLITLPITLPIISTAAQTTTTAPTTTTTSASTNPTTTTTSAATNPTTTSDATETTTSTPSAATDTTTSITSAATDTTTSAPSYATDTTASTPSDVTDSTTSTPSDATIPTIWVTPTFPVSTIAVPTVPSVPYIVDYYLVRKENQFALQDVIASKEAITAILDLLPDPVSEIENEIRYILDALRVIAFYAYGKLTFLANSKILTPAFTTQTYGWYENVFGLLSSQIRELATTSSTLTDAVRTGLISILDQIESQTKQHHYVAKLLLNV